MSSEHFFDRQRSAAESPASGDPASPASTSPPTTEPRAENRPAAEAEPGARQSLPPEARNALVSLLRNGCILAAQKKQIFDALCRYQSPLRQHLADMYLRLILDERQGVAYIANSPRDMDDTAAGSDDSSEASRLIVRRPLTLYDTLLLLVLRKYYQERETQGEQKVILDIERIEAGLTPFLPLTNSSRSDRRQLKTSLTRMLEKKLVSVVRGNQDRFEISPLIRYVVSAEFLQTMLRDYQRLAGELAPAGASPQTTAPAGNTDNGSD